MVVEDVESSGTGRLRASDPLMSAQAGSRATPVAGPPADASFDAALEYFGHWFDSLGPQHRSTTMCALAGRCTSAELAPVLVRCERMLSDAAALFDSDDDSYDAFELRTIPHMHPPVGPPAPLGPPGRGLKSYNGNSDSADTPTQKREPKTAPKPGKLGAGSSQGTDLASAAPAASSAAAAKEPRPDQKSNPTQSPRADRRFLANNAGSPFAMNSFLSKDMYSQAFAPFGQPAQLRSAPFTSWALKDETPATPDVAGSAGPAATAPSFSGLGNHTWSSGHLGGSHLHNTKRTWNPRSASTQPKPIGPTGSAAGSSVSAPPSAAPVTPAPAPAPGHERLGQNFGQGSLSSSTSTQSTASTAAVSSANPASPPHASGSSSTTEPSGQAPSGGSQWRVAGPPRPFNSKRPVNFADPELLQDISAWLRSLRLHKYTENLSDIPWQQVIRLTDRELEARGVNALGARRKMLKMFEEIRLAQAAGQLPE